MDEQHSETPAPISASPAASSPAASLPSIGTLFTDSWHTLTKSMLNLFLITLILFGTMFVGMLGIVSVTIFSGFVGKSLTPESLFATLMSLGLVAIFMIGIALLLIILYMAIVAAEFIVIDGAAQAISVGAALKRGFKKVFPLIMVSILSSLIAFGGFFFFVIPAILFSLFFLFATIEVVLTDNSTWGAIKRSTAIVMHNFGGIFVRLLLIWVASVVVSLTLQYVMGTSGRTVQWPVIGLSMIVNILFSWYTICYLITLYKQARAITPVDKKVNMAWILILSLLGWLIFAGVVFAGYKAMSHENFPLLWQAMTTGKVAEDSVMEKEEALQPVPESQIRTLQEKTMAAVDLYRIQKKLPVWKVDGDLCAYAQRRLEQLQKFGRLDDYKGFKEDTTDAKIWDAYFSSYENINESDYYPLAYDKVSGFVPSPVDIALYFGNSKQNTAVNQTKNTSGCIRAHGKFMVIMSAEPSTR